LRSHTGPGKERAHSVSPGPTGGYSTNKGYSSRDFAYGPDFGLPAHPDLENAFRNNEPGVGEGPQGIPDVNACRLNWLLEQAVEKLSESGGVGYPEAGLGGSDTYLDGQQSRFTAPRNIETTTDYAGLNRTSTSALKEICCCQRPTNPTMCWSMRPADYRVFGNPLEHRLSQARCDRAAFSG
jgi:hypothetical protein